MDIPTSVLKLPNSHPEHLCQLCMLWEFSNLSSFLSLSLDLNIAWIPGNWHNFLFFFPWRPKNRDLEWLDFTPVLALNKPWKLKHITLWCSSSLGLFSFIWAMPLGLGKREPGKTWAPRMLEGEKNGRNLGHGVWQDGGLPWQHQEEEVARFCAPTVFVTPCHNDPFPHPSPPTRLRVSHSSSSLPGLSWLPAPFLGWG